MELSGAVPSSLQYFGQAALGGFGAKGRLDPEALTG